MRQELVSHLSGSNLTILGGYRFTQAAVAGHPKAQAIIAACYWDGMGVSQDVQQAVKW